MRPDKTERWIWTELLAFDRNSEDRGTAEYLKKLGFVPDGISLLLSAVDFILLHKGMEQEYTLFPDICSRVAHERNEERHRQEWTNWELRELVSELRKRNIKVFFSIFNYYLENKFHEEFASLHPEIQLASRFHTPNYGFSLIARMNDGSLLEDLFVRKLKEVALDYGFSGWHGADSQGPLASLSSGDASDEMFFQFADHLGAEKFPSELLKEQNHSLNGLIRRMDYIWNFLKKEWADFNSMRWCSLWKKATDAMHSIGCETMINSPFTRSLMESLVYFGLDQRKINEMGVDYMLVETVATSVSVIDGKYERVFDYCAMLGELRALLPDMKFIIMSPVKDVVENWDAFRHAPERLERDMNLLANQYVLRNGKLKRCADGQLYCLGDGILKEEWNRLNRLNDDIFGFTPETCGELTWLVESSSFDRLRDDHIKYGTYPPYLQVSDLVQNCGLDISCVADAAELDHIKTPVLVPDFHLFPEEVKEKILAVKDKIVILLGNFAGYPDLTENNPAVIQPMTADYLLGCVVLNTSLPATGNILKKYTGPAFVCGEYRSIVEEHCPLMQIPERFREETGKLIRNALGKAELENPVEDRMHVFTMENKTARRISFYSDREGYGRAAFRFRSPVKSLKKCSGFPYSDFLTDGDRLIMDNYNRTPIVIPPRGIVTIQVEQ